MRTATKVTVAASRDPSGSATVAAAGPAPGTPLLDRWAFSATVAVIVLLSAVHLYYVCAARLAPSTDEAHYMGGSLSIAEGLRSGTLAGAWRGYQNALGFKPPLVCVPGALLMLAMGGLRQPNLVSLVVTFFALGLASYSLFRRCLRPFRAAVATTLLLTMPMITGLTHQFYVELLLVLLCVVYVDVLLGQPWRSTARSAFVGGLLGLGLLCKVSFPVLVALPTAYSLGLAARHLPRVQLWSMLPRIVLAGAVATLVAGSWYLKNWRATVLHARISAVAADAYYRHWIQADISVGPWIVVFCCAVIGFGVVVARLTKGSLDAARRQAWIMLLLFGLTTIFLTAIAIDKATRYTATALPMIACLAVAAWPDTGAARWPQYGLIALAAASTLLALHISFDILPIGEIRIGDVRIMDSHFPLNVPGAAEDNHPVDRRHFPLEEAEAIVARDARGHLAPGRTAEARTTVLSLVINHDYFQVLAAANKSPVHWTWWPGSVSTGPAAPDYILGFEGFDAIYPSRAFHNYYPNLRADVAAGRAPYRVLSHLEGPSHTSIWIYAKRP